MSTNSQRPATFNRVFAGGALRAHFSPVGRAQSLGRFARPMAQSGALSATAVPRLRDSLEPTAAVPLERWWDPHLVDRLSTPLTRIHE